MTSPRPIGIYHEHPDWFRPLFAELDRRGTPYVRLDAGAHRFDPPATRAAVRAGVQPHEPVGVPARRGVTASSTRCTISRTSSGSACASSTARAAFPLETSKALQLTLLESLGLPYPRRA